MQLSLLVLQKVQTEMASRVQITFWTRIPLTAVWLTGVFSCVFFNSKYTAEANADASMWITFSMYHIGHSQPSKICIFFTVTTLQYFFLIQDAEWHETTTRAEEEVSVTIYKKSLDYLNLLLYLNLNDFLLSATNMPSMGSSESSEKVNPRSIKCV